MTTETLPNKNLTDEASQALTKLYEIKATIAQDLTDTNSDYLQQALSNFHFIENAILDAVGGFFSKNEGRISFGYKTISFFGELPIVFSSKEGNPQLEYAFAPERKPAKLTEDLIKRLWNANINQNAVKAFGKLSREDIVDRFQSQILSSIK